MNLSITTSCLLLISFASYQASAQDCKPDVVREDKISKQRIEVWAQELSASSFGSNLLSSSDSKIVATVGRYGGQSAINLQVEKRERSATNALLESQYRAAVGQPFFFGLKDAEPLSFMVTNVSNQAARGKLLNDDKLITTVVLSAVVSDARMAAVRDVLTSRPIDAVRMNLAGGLQIEKSVNDKNGEKMRANFACFFQSLERRGVVLSGVVPARAQTSAGSSGAASLGSDVAKVSGRYSRRGKATDYLVLNADGTLALRQDSVDYVGTFTAGGDTLSVKLSNGQNGTATISDNRLVDNSGTEWERAGVIPAPASASKGAGAAITMDQILQMIAAKLPDDVVIASIEKANPKPSAAPADLIRLKAAGASDAVIRTLAK